MTIEDKLTAIANSVPLVYDAGYNKGKAEGGNTEEAYARGVADGKQAEYDNFWEMFQDGGRRTNYRRAFIYWMEEPKPKYFTELSNDVGIDRSTNGAEVFTALGLKSNATTNNPQGDMIDVSYVCSMFDFSKCANVNNLFANARAKNITVNLSGCNTITRAFANGDYGRLDNITVTFSEKNVFDNTFTGTNTLTTLTIKGTIGNSISFADSPLLTSESVQSVIDALATVTEAKTITFNEEITLTAAQIAEIDGKGWDLVQ